MGNTGTYIQYDKPIIFLNETFPIIIAFILSVVLYTLIMKKWSFKKAILTILFIFYISMVIGITLFPIPISNESLNLFQQMYAVEEIRRINWGIHFIGLFRFEFLANMIMFAPLGFYLRVYKLNNHSIKFYQILMIVLISSLCIETVQYLIMHFFKYYKYYVDIEDVLANTLGGVLGYVLALMLFKNSWISSLFKLNKDE